MAATKESNRSKCTICRRPDVLDVESFGVMAKDRRLSWSEAARRAHVPINSLRNHMAKHVGASAEHGEIRLNDYDSLITSTIRALREKAELVPAEVKPYYIIAMHNLQGIKATAPNQGTLVNALRAITETTGMKMEQQLMLQFMDAKFGESKVDRELAAESADELPVPIVVPEGFIEVASDE